MTPDEYNAKVKERRELHQMYWTQFLEAPTRIGDDPMEVSLTQAYMRYALPHQQFHVAAVLPITEPGIRVELSMLGPNRRNHLEWFRARSIEIETALGEGPPIDWRERNKPFNRQCQIGRTYSEYDPRDRQSWPEQHGLLADQVRLFRGTFGSLVRELASDA
jgi:hypothetical protein